ALPPPAEPPAAPPPAAPPPVPPLGSLASPQAGRIRARARASRTVADARTTPTLPARAAPYPYPPGRSAGAGTALPARAALYPGPPGRGLRLTTSPRSVTSTSGSRGLISATKVPPGSAPLTVRAFALP